MTKQYPEPVVGAYVLNDKNQVLLIRSPKWSNGQLWVVAGGHIEMGESIEQALVREVKEELGIKVKYDRVFNVLEGIFPKNFHTKKHFIYLQSLCWIVPGEEVKIDNQEVVEAKWWAVDQALSLEESQLYPQTRKSLKILKNMIDSGLLLNK